MNYRMSFFVTNSLKKYIFLLSILDIYIIYNLLIITYEINRSNIKKMRLNIERILVNIYKRNYWHLVLNFQARIFKCNMQK